MKLQSSADRVLDSFSLGESCHIHRQSSIQVVQEPLICKPDALPFVRLLKDFNLVGIRSVGFEMPNYTLETLCPSDPTPFSWYFAICRRSFNMTDVSSLECLVASTSPLIATSPCVPWVATDVTTCPSFHPRLTAIRMAGFFAESCPDRVRAQLLTPQSLVSVVRRHFSDITPPLPRRRRPLIATRIASIISAESSHPTIPRTISWPIPWW